MAIDLHKVAKTVNLAIPVLLVLALLAARFMSWWFWIPAVILLLCSISNVYLLYGQERNSLLRNFGLLAQARYALQSLGPELRQYWFSSDTEERPFNRIERDEVYRKSLDQDSALSFGSQGQFDAHEVKIRHSMFPVPKGQLEAYRVTFGEERNCPNAFTIDKPVIISAMSFGALGSKAVRSLARGARLAGIPMNTGEGGYPKYHLAEGADLIFQMGTAKFGVRNEDATLNDELLRELAAEEHVRAIEIKFSQGAKPGKGGLLPKEKISEEISQLRNVPRGQDVVSPPGHIECTDVTSTVQFIKRVQEVSQLPTGIKMCLGNVVNFRALIVEMMTQNTFPDWIAIDGAEGGTGAAPQSFMDYVGVPLLPGLHTVHQLLDEMGVRQQTKLLAAGKLVNAARMIVAMSLGADACYTARGFMLALGCIQALQCGKNTCPIGITTHDPALQRGMVIEDKSQRIKHYVHHLMHDYEQLMTATGSRSIRDLTYEDLYIPQETDLAAIIRQPMPEAS